MNGNAVWRSTNIYMQYVFTRYLSKIHITCELSVQSTITDKISHEIVFKCLWVWTSSSEMISTNSESLFRLVQNKISATLSGKTCSNYEWAIIFDQNGKRLVSVVMSKYYLTSQPNIIRVSCMNYGNCQRLEKDWNRHSRHKPSK